MFISRRRNFMKARIHDVINRSVHNAKKETSTSIDAIPYIYIRWRYTEFFCAVNIDQCNSHSVHLRWSGEKCRKFEYALRHVGRMVNMTRKEGKDRGIVGSIETKRSAYTVHIGNRCVHSPVATLHTHLSDFMNVCIARRFFLSWPTVSWQPATIYWRFFVAKTFN